MIKIKSLTFSNILSYGDNNLIDFTSGVTQLVGVNGAGKSSIPTILEEALYNKNSRGIKKADLFNRFTSSKTYNITVFFSIDSDEFVLTKSVGSSTKLILVKNDEDISGHTATQTYKTIEALIGVDFTTFSKLVYQSMVSSLDFLNATDANRKKFLVSLLGLEKYVEIESKVKEYAKGIKLKTAELKGELDTYDRFIKSNLGLGELTPLPKVEKQEYGDLEDLVSSTQATLKDIAFKNSVIRKNIKAKQDLGLLSPVLPVEKPEPISAEIRLASQKLGREVTVLESEFSKLNRVKDTCPTCHQKVNIQDTLDRLAELEKEIKPKKESFRSSTKLMDVFNKQSLEYDKYKTYETKLNNLREQYSESLGTSILEESEVRKEVQTLKAKIESIKLMNKLSEDKYNQVKLSNESLKTKKEQLKEYETKYNTCKVEYDSSNLLSDRLDLLISALGPKGLIAYKIESMVKDFEALINYYLQELSEGRFVLEFIMEDSKLKMKLFCQSSLVDIKSLSSGEYNRVNTATLLAIRSMLSSISKVNIDLLFLDEVVSVLDEDGKNTLIELLLKEQNINSVLVSHGYTHPLTRKIKVVKNNDISELI